MKLIIKLACVANGVNLRAWEPADSKAIAEFIYLGIGEKGTTGTREAAITLLLSQKCELPKPKTKPVMLNSAEELFERLLDNRRKIKLLQSDNRQ